MEGIAVVVVVVAGVDIRAAAVDTRKRHDGHIEAGICGYMVAPWLAGCELQRDPSVLVLIVL